MLVLNFILLLSFAISAAGAEDGAVSVCSETIRSQISLKQRLQSMTKKELKTKDPSWFAALGADIRHLHPHQIDAIPNEAAAALTEEQWAAFSKAHFRSFTLPQMRAVRHANRLSIMCKAPNAKGMEPNITPCLLSEAVKSLTKRYPDMSPENQTYMDDLFKSLLL